MTTQSFHQDTIGEWFRSLPSEFDIQIPVALLRHGSNIPEWYSYNHREFDGVGALMDLLEKNGFSRIGTGASGSISDCKGLQRWWKLILFMLKFHSQKKKFATTPWKTTAAEISDKDLPCGIAWYCFSKEASDALINHAASKNVSLNSFLLSALNASISPSLLRAPQNARNWMLPVNLRGRLLLKNVYSNHSMWLDVEADQGASCEKIHKLVRSQLKGGIPWLNYLIATYILNKGIKMDLDSQPHHCGTQSNLGVWPSPNNVVMNETESTTISNILFVPPVQKSNLLSTGVVTWGGRLNIALHTHPALANSPAQVESILRAWVAVLQKEAGIPDLSLNINFSPANTLAPALGDAREQNSGPA